MRTKRRLTDAEREQRREHDRQRLQQAAEQLLTSEGWQRWVRVRARGGLARLSLNNQLLVALCCPEATFVAGFKAWLASGYCARKGERAIRIIAPIPIKPTDGQDSDEDGSPPRMLFKAVSVFDRSQVAPLDGVEPTPLDPPREPLTGDSHAQLLAPLQAFTEPLGFTVSFESIPGATGGWCDQKARRTSSRTISSLPVAVKSPVACNPPVRSKVGCRRRSGSAASSARSTRGPGWARGAWTATSSRAPLPHTPQDEVV
jgi:hypothetical protein